VVCEGEALSAPNSTVEVELPFGKLSLSADVTMSDALTLLAVALFVWVLAWAMGHMRNSRTDGDSD